MAIDSSTLPSPSDRSTRRPLRRRHSLFFPLLLIAIGVIVLLRNTNILTGSAWDLVLSLWPLILVFGGLDGLYRREGVVGPIFWGSMGVLFLAANFGLLRFTALDLILHLWPLLLIALGLDLLLGRSSWLGAVISVAILAALVAGSLWMMSSGVTLGGAESSTINQPLEGASAADISMDMVANGLSVSAMTEDTNTLAAGTVRLNQYEKLHTSYTSGPGTGQYRIWTGGAVTAFPGLSNSAGWNIQLTRNIPLTLDLHAAAGDYTLDLKDLQVTQVNANLAAGKIKVIAPLKTDSRITFSLPIGETELVVSPGVGVRLETNTLGVVLDLPDGYTHSDKVYQSPNYASSETKVDVVLDQVLGKFTLHVEK